MHDTTEHGYLFDPQKYVIETFDDELRVDELCK